eukprot:1609686-Rhodomonas_salina.2
MHPRYPPTPSDAVSSTDSVLSAYARAMRRPVLRLAYAATRRGAYYHRLRCYRAMCGTGLGYGTTTHFGTDLGCSAATKRGTDLGYDATAQRGTELAYAASDSDVRATSLPACYAIPGTDLACAATSLRDVLAYAATRALVGTGIAYTAILLLPPYRPTRLLCNPPVWHYQDLSSDTMRRIFKSITDGYALHPEIKYKKPQFQYNLYH